MVSKIKLDGRGPIYEQIHRALSEPIRSGLWPPGTRLPSEHELMTELAVSRMTVTKAMEQLADDGLVIRRRRAGTFVAPQVEEHALVKIADMAEEIRHAGHVYAYQLLGTRLATARPEEVMRLGLRPHNAGLARPPAILEVRCLHLADGDPAVHEDRLISIDAVPDAISVDFTATPPNSWLLARIPWTKAKHTITAINAAGEVAKLLRLADGDACLLVERNTWQGDKPVTQVRLTYPGHRHRLVGSFSPGRT